jgi:NADH-quinone oxidoreductase subunit C
VAHLAARFAAAPFALGVTVPAGELATAMRALRDAHGYRYYVLAVGTELESAFEVAHAVRHPDTGDTLFVRVEVGKDGAEVDSLALVFAGAEWQEREIWDLLGVRFRGHPDLRRILLPDEYEGHPLRKSFAMNTPWGYRKAAPEAGA